MSMEGRDRKFVWMLTWRDLTLPTQQPVPPKGRSSQPWLSAEPPEEFHILLVPRLNPRPVNQNLWRQNAGICIFKVFLGDSFGQLGMRILQWIIVFSHLIFFSKCLRWKELCKKVFLRKSEAQRGWIFATIPWRGDVQGKRFHGSGRRSDERSGLAAPGTPREHTPGWRWAGALRLLHGAAVWLVFLVLPISNFPDTERVLFYF